MCSLRSRLAPRVLACVAGVIAALAPWAAGAPLQDGPAPVPPAVAGTTPRTLAAEDEGIRATAPARVPLGEWFEVTISGPIPPQARLGLAAPLRDLLQGPVRSRSTIVGSELLVSLAAWRAGALRIAGLQLEDGERVLSLAPLEVEVWLELPPGHSPRVAEPLPAFDLPLPPTPVGLIAALLVAALAAIGAWIVVASRVTPVVVPVTPPDQVAMAALERLRLVAPSTPEEVAGLVVSTSAVLRTYIEGRFAVHAPARTTEEFLLEALGQPVLAERRATLERFLTLCDLVKYARHRPAPAEAEGLLDTAAAFVEQTR